MIILFLIAVSSIVVLFLQVTVDGCDISAVEVKRNEVNSAWSSLNILAQQKSELVISAVRAHQFKQ